MTASEGLFDGRGQRVVIGVEDEDSEQLCRLGLARVAADRMDTARRFGPALAYPIDAREPMSLKNKNVVVTGGSPGLGRGEDLPIHGARRGKRLLAPLLRTRLR